MHEATAELINMLKPNKSGIPDNDPERIRAILRRGGAYNYQGVEDRNSFLHSLAWYGFYETIEVLIEHAKHEDKAVEFVNLANKDGWTPLHQVAYSDIRDNKRIKTTINLLIHSGAVFMGKVYGAAEKDKETRGANVLKTALLRANIDSDRFYYMAAYFFAFHHGLVTNFSVVQSDFRPHFQCVPKDTLFGELRDLLLQCYSYTSIPKSDIEKIIQKIMEIEENFEKQRLLQLENKIHVLQNDNAGLKRKVEEWANKIDQLQRGAEELQRQKDASEAKAFAAIEEQRRKIELLEQHLTSVMLQVDVLFTMGQKNFGTISGKTKNDMIGAVSLSSSMHRFQADVDNEISPINVVPEVP